MAERSAFLAWLLSTSLQAGVLVCLVLLVQRLLGGRLSPRWRWALWLLVVARLVMPWTPESPVSIFNLPRLFLHGRQPVEAAIPAVRTVEERHAFTPAPDVPAPPPYEVSAAASTAPPPAVAAHAPSVPAHNISISPWNALILLWLSGFLGLSAVVIVQGISLSRAVRRGRRITEKSALDVLERSKAILGIRVPVALVESTFVTSPSLFGAVRPRLLLPEGMVESARPETLRFIFLHELAHLKRHDVPLNWLVSALQFAHWFNPLIWYGFYRMRADRELACDSLALSYIKPAEANDYGRTILGLFEGLARPRRWAGMVGILENGSQLKRRIAMIAGHKPGSYRWSLPAAALITLLAVTTLTCAESQKPPAAPEKPAVAAPAPAAPAPPAPAVPAEAAPAEGPDVKVTDKDLVVSLRTDGCFETQVTLANKGTAASPAFKVQFYATGPGKKERLIGGVHSAGPIEAGKKWIEITGPFSLTKGEDTIVAVFDPEKVMGNVQRAVQSIRSLTAPTPTETPVIQPPLTAEGRQLLEKRLAKVDFGAEEISNTVIFLQDAGDANIVLDASAIPPSGLFVSLRLKNVTLKSILDIMTAQTGLDWVCVDNYIYISTDEGVRILLSRGKAGSGGGGAAGERSLEGVSEVWIDSGDIVERSNSWHRSVEATIHSKGHGTLSNVPVRFLVGKPGMQGEEIEIGTRLVDIEAGKDARVAIPWDPKPGQYQVSAVLDPDNNVPQVDKTARRASMQFTIRADGWQPAGTAGVSNLWIDPEDMMFFTADDGAKWVVATIHNKGRATSAEVEVRFFVGDPDKGGKEIGTGFAVPEPGKDWREGTPFDPEPGEYRVFAVIDPDHKVPQVDKVWNRASMLITVGSESKPPEK